MKLITFEGIEGVGKSLQIQLIQDWLNQSGYSVKLLREPGSTHFGEKIRALLLSNDSDISYQTELLLMFAARTEMIKEHVENSQEDFILCDRYYHSSLAYQGYGRGLSLDLINNLIASLNCPVPALTIIYDLDVSEGFTRKANDSKDRIESSSLEFFESVRKGYKELAQARDEVYLVDASPSPEIIHELTKKIIQEKCL